jgi:beta-glucuronidase
MNSRRKFLGWSAAAALALPAAHAAKTSDDGGPGLDLPLDGAWSFRLDPDGRGEAAHWHDAAPGEGWRTVAVPHTWQIEADQAEYRGVAWYRREFHVAPEWLAGSARIEFEAVFHSATVWINGAPAGSHTGKGYTAFTIDATRHLRAGANTIAVRVDNAFNDAMLPRGRSSDWAHDGGIYRPVHLLVAPAVYIERVAVDTDLDLATKDAALEVTAVVRNTRAAAWTGRVTAQVRLETSSEPALALPMEAQVELASGETKHVRLSAATLRQPSLWHFDHPALYVLEARLSNGHAIETTFGVRRIEVRGAAFYLNGERVRLMGVERMAGSNPEYGMAEPAEWIAHDHADMQELNCVYTRVHWPQDRRVLDWCDRHGMFIQTEVPTWGPDTFKGMEREPAPAILDNGLAQLREMVDRDRNHPCIFSWGVCNEIGGQNPPAYDFARRMYAEAKRLDPRRLVSYASNSLQQTPARDVSALMDYVMWNEYYESWYAGTPGDLARNLDAIHAAFPGKAIVISEYGYCACTADRPEGDAKRIRVLREHDRVFRERDFVAGLIFFDYNDYRTHIGDRGTGVMRQRVHGVVDVYGARKPSFAELRREASPIESIAAVGTPAKLRVAIQTRATIPSYLIKGYELRGVAYGFGGIPVERRAAPLGSAAAGAPVTLELNFQEPGIARIELDVLRPTGVSACGGTWRY